MMVSTNGLNSLNADKHSPASSARSTKWRVRGMLMSAFADQNHAPSLTCVRLEFKFRVEEAEVSFGQDEFMVACILPSQSTITY